MLKEISGISVDIRGFRNVTPSQSAETLAFSRFRAVTFGCYVTFRMRQNMRIPAGCDGVTVSEPGDILTGRKGWITPVHMVKPRRPCSAEERSRRLHQFLGRRPGHSSVKPSGGSSPSARNPATASSCRHRPKRARHRSSSSK
jgi:hypothetical protein